MRKGKITPDALEIPEAPPKVRMSFRKIKNSWLGASGVLVSEPFLHLSTRCLLVLKAPPQHQFLQVSSWTSHFPPPKRLRLSLNMEMSMEMSLITSPNLAPGSGALLAFEGHLANIYSHSFWVDLIRPAFQVLRSVYCHPCLDELPAWLWSKHFSSVLWNRLS